MTSSNSYPNIKSMYTQDSDLFGLAWRGSEVQSTPMLRYSTILRLVIYNIAINRLSYEYDPISGEFIHSFIHSFITVNAAAVNALQPIRRKTFDLVSSNPSFLRFYADITFIFVNLSRISITYRPISITYTLPITD